MICYYLITDLAPAIFLGLALCNLVHSNGGPSVFTCSCWIMPPSLLRIIGYNAIYKYIDTFHKYLSLYTVYIYILLYMFVHI